MWFLGGCVVAIIFVVLGAYMALKYFPIGLGLLLFAIGYYLGGNAVMYLLSFPLMLVVFCVFDKFGYGKTMDNSEHLLECIKETNVSQNRQSILFLMRFVSRVGLLWMVSLIIIYACLCYSGYWDNPIGAMTGYEYPGANIAREHYIKDLKDSFENILTLVSGAVVVAWIYTQDEIAQIEEDYEIKTGSDLDPSTEHVFHKVVSIPGFGFFTLDCFLLPLRVFRHTIHKFFEFRK